MSKKRTNYLVAVVSNGECRHLFYSHDLSDLPMLKEMYRGCSFEIADLRPYREISKKSAKVVTPQKAFLMHKRGKGATKVLCRTTGKVFDSVKACSEELGIPVMTIYQAIRRNFAASKMYFEYLIEDEGYTVEEDD